MNILTIDMDYIANSALSSEIGKLVQGPNTLGAVDSMYWDRVDRMLGDHAPNKLDSRNLEEIVEVFSKYVARGRPNVVFGLDHDSILLHIGDRTTDITVINLDQHHDLIYSNESHYNISEFGRVTEGDWVYYIKDRVIRYCWVGNEGSEEPLFTNFKYERFNLFRDIEDIPYQFDLIYVCLSPGYLHKKYWKYFWQLKDLADNLVGYTPLETRRLGDQYKLTSELDWRAGYGSS